MTNKKKYVQFISQTIASLPNIECLEIDKIYKARKQRENFTEKETQMALKTYEKLFNFNHRKISTIFYCIGWAKVETFLLVRWAKIQKCVNTVGRTVGNSSIAGGGTN